MWTLVSNCVAKDSNPKVNDSSRWSSVEVYPQIWAESEVQDVFDALSLDVSSRSGQTKVKSQVERGRQEETQYG